MKNLSLVLLGLILGYALTLVIATIEENTVAEQRPAYLVVLGEVYDRMEFMEGYVAKLPSVYDQYGGAYLAVGGGDQIEVLEGQYTPPSFVISRWESMDAARKFWNSTEYAPLKRARIDNEWGDFDVLLVEGLAGSK